MKLTTLRFEGRRASYYALVYLEVVDNRTVRVVDETTLWTVWVERTALLDERMGGMRTGFFWARLRGGDVDLHKREDNPVDWDPYDEDDEEGPG